MDSREKLETILQITSSLLRLLVDEPDKLQIKISRDASTFMLQVSAPRSDVGKLIGVQGRIAHSLRVLLLAMAAPLQTRISLDIQTLESSDGV